MIKLRRTAIDLTGQRFGKLVCLVPVDKCPTTRSIIWKCQCDCGNIQYAKTALLRYGKVKSCGCYHKEAITTHGQAYAGHVRPGGGLAPTPTYSSWCAMRNRILNPNNQAYDNYGGRGLDIDPRWDDFEVFLADMGERPDGTTIERILNDKGYWPWNCRWATPREQAQNRRYHGVHRA